MNEEIEIVNPKIIVTLGNVALKAVLTDESVTIGALHGNIVYLKDKAAKLFPLYHPASIIYNRSLKEVYFNDLLSLRKIIESN